MISIKKQKGFGGLIYVITLFVFALIAVYEVYVDIIKTEEKRNKMTQEAISDIPNFTNELYSDLSRLKEISKNLVESKNLDDNFVKVKEFILSPALERVKESNNKEAGNVKLVGINIANDINLTQYIDNSISDDDSMVELNIDTDSIIDADWYYRTRIINGHNVNDICVDLNEAITTDDFSGNIYETNCKGEEGKSAFILYDRIQTFYDLIDFNKDSSYTDQLVWIEDYEISGFIDINGELVIIAEFPIETAEYVGIGSYAVSLEKKLKEDKRGFEYTIFTRSYQFTNLYMEGEFKIL